MKKALLFLIALSCGVSLMAQKTFSHNKFTVEYNPTEWNLNSSEDSRSSNLTSFYSNKGSDVISIVVTPMTKDLKYFAADQLATNSVFSGKTLVHLREETVGDHKTLFYLCEYKNDYGSGKVAAWFFAENDNIFIVTQLFTGNSYTAGKTILKSLKSKFSKEE